jgi:hypothetical protein
MQSNVSAIAQRINALKLYKELYKHFRSNKQLTASTSFHEVLRNEFRENSVTDAKYCVESKQLYFLANAYLNYLNSTKETHRLYGIYSKGERSIEESAAIVGLKLPKQYEPNK